MDKLDLLNPHELYTKSLKSQHIKNAEAYFDSLVKTSQVDVELNKNTVIKLNDCIKERNRALKKENNIQAARIWLIILIVLCFVAGIVFLALFFSEYSQIWHIIVSVLTIGLGVFVIVMVCTKLNPELKRRKAHREALDKEVDEIRNECYMQLLPLNSLFDWNIPTDLVMTTAPLIKMDKNFDMEKYEYLHEKYGFSIDSSIHKSVVFVQSGSIEGNPFLIEKIKNQDMIDHTYTGSIVITWTESRYVNGKRETVRRSQTLTASVTKPKPRYFYETWLIYGNDAAPNLNFSRKPSPAKNKNDKQLKRYVESKEKKLDKLAENTLMDNIPGEYTKMANAEFDVLFGAQDRDNETEFRLLFTPLAQKSMLKLIKEDEPYGDDFYFLKKKCLNYIYATHADGFNFDADPNIFTGYDIEAMKKFFVAYNDNYMKSFFFQLAPLLTIPLYQQQKPVEYIYQRKFDANITQIEHEVMANALNYNLLRPEECATDLILKTEFIKKNDNADNVAVTSYGFKEVHHTTYVSVYGGDGRYHNVPVNWIEYVQVSSNNLMEVSEQAITRKDFDEKSKTVDYGSYMGIYAKGRQGAFQRGLLSILLNQGILNSDINVLNSILKK